MTTFRRFEGDPCGTTTLVSSGRGDLDLRRSPTRAAAFEAARDLAIEALAREAEKRWLRSEVVSIRIGVDPDQR
jgi:hypothetical protein